MGDFENVPLTVTERKILANQEQQKRQKILYKIGYNTAGCYELTFPNGKKYIGKSIKLGHRIADHLRELIPTNGKVIKKYSMNWYAIAVKENEGRLNSISDIRIRGWRSKSCDILEKQLLSSIPVEERCNYYNEIFYD